MHNGSHSFNKVDLSKNINFARVQKAIVYKKIKNQNLNELKYRSA